MSSASFIPRLLAIVGCLAVVFALVQAPAKGAARISVTGIVTGDASGNPALGRVGVCATRYSEDGEDLSSKCVRTGSDGRYVLSLAPGRYALSAGEPDLAGYWAAQKYAGGKIIRMGASRVANFKLAPGGYISGYLRTPEGNAPGRNRLDIWAFQVDSRGKYDRFGAHISRVNEDGYFSVSKLPAGRYAVQIYDHGLVFAEQWYPKSGTVPASTFVSVAAGRESAGNDMTLTYGSTLALTLKGPKGKSEMGSIELYDSAGRQVANDSTSTKGVVKFIGLFPGQYRARGTASSARFTRWYASKRSFSTANPITVGARSTVQKTFPLNYPTLKAKKRPRARINLNAVEAFPPKWKKKARNGDVIWYRDGKRLNGRVGSFILTRKSDAGHRMKACYTGYAAGYGPGRSCSKYTPKITQY